jgi:effector-binding domain-containing protein
MEENPAGIQHKTIKKQLFAATRFNLQCREDLYPFLHELAGRIPGEVIVGPPLSVVHFITNVESGLDLEVGFPVLRPVEAPGITTRPLPETEVLALVHQGKLEDLRDSYRALFGWAYEHGVISDEIGRELYLDWGENSIDSTEHQVELQFVVHNWNALLGEHTARVLGQGALLEVMQGADALGTESTHGQRFEWVKTAMDRLDRLAGEPQKYEILSRCAHVFPQEHIERLRAVFEENIAITGDAMQAVDAVIAFMQRDRVWGSPPVRQENVIFATKNPRDPQAFARATSQAERRRAYCFCPLIRDHLDNGVSPIFCYCGAGWERQQWEGTIGAPLHIEVVQSLVNGDECCQFAIHLPASF